MFVEAGPSPDSGKTLPSLQAKLYPLILRQSLLMRTKQNDHVAAAMEAFVKNARMLMKHKGVESDSELARMVEKKTDGAARKTINNILAGRHDARIGKLSEIAGALDCPLWVLLIPGLTQQDIDSPNRERMIALMKNYLACSLEERSHIENMASAFAAKPKK